MATFFRNKNCRATLQDAEQSPESCKDEIEPALRESGLQLLVFGKKILDLILRGNVCIAKIVYSSE